MVRKARHTASHSKNLIQILNFKFINLKIKILAEEKLNVNFHFDDFLGFRSQF